MQIDFDADDSVSDFVTVPAGTYHCRVGEIRRLGTGLSHVELSAEEGGAPHQRDADELPLIVSGGTCRLDSVETQREAVLFKEPAHRASIVTRGARSPQDRTTPRIVL